MAQSMCFRDASDAVRIKRMRSISICCIRQQRIVQSPVGVCVHARRCTTTFTKMETVVVHNEMQGVMSLRRRCKCGGELRYAGLFLANHSNNVSQHNRKYLVCTCRLLSGLYRMALSSYEPA